jgi:hypothetical protein
MKGNEIYGIFRILCPFRITLNLMQPSLERKTPCVSQKGEGRGLFCAELPLTEFFPSRNILAQKPSIKEPGFGFWAFFYGNNIEA